MKQQDDQLPIPAVTHWGAEIDYLKARRDCQSDEEAQDAMRHIGAACVAVRAIFRDEAGAWEKPTEPLGRWEGYGYVGWADKHVRWGRRDNSIFVQCSGYRAHWLAQELLDYVIPTRLDTQITIWHDSDIEHVPELRFNEYRARMAARPLRRAAAGRLVLNPGKGNTFYVGERGQWHGRCLRVYDKDRESKRLEVWRNAVRYEAELTGRHAERSYAYILEHGFSPKVIAKATHTIFFEMGASVYAPGMQLIGQQAMPRVATRRPNTRAWIERQVSPAVRKLLRAGVSIPELAELLAGSPSTLDEALELEQMKERFAELLTRAWSDINRTR